MSTAPQGSLNFDVCARKHQGNPESVAANPSPSGKQRDRQRIYELALVRPITLKEVVKNQTRKSRCPMTPLSLDPAKLEQAASHLRVALLQSLPSDDQIILGHVRQALGALDPRGPHSDSARPDLSRLLAYVHRYTPKPQPTKCEHGEEFGPEFKCWTCDKEDLYLDGFVQGKEVA